MRIIVTGGAGFIGSHIVDALVAAGHEVMAVDNLSSGRWSNLESNGWIIQVEGDIRTDRFVATVEQFKPDAICHQAAQPSLLISVEQPALDAEINILGTLNVIQAARRAGAHVVMASTSAVYSDLPALQPYRENSPLDATRPYGIAKMSAEQYLRHSGLRYTLLRYGNIYGPRQIPVGENQLVPHALDHIYKGAPFTVNGDGEQTRDFVYVGDVAAANVAALTAQKVGIYNAGSGKAHSVNEVLTILKELTRFEGEFRRGPAKPGEPRRVALDSTAANRELGWWAGTKLFNGLVYTVEWYKQAHGIGEYCTCGHFDDEHDQEDVCLVCDCSNYQYLGYGKRKPVMEQA